MIIILKEKEPMFRELGLGVGEAIWFSRGEEFEVVETKVMKHDNQEWFKIKSKWFSEPLAGFHNPRSFDIKKSGD